MSQLGAYAAYEYFRVTSPAEFVAHVEINRPAKLNAFTDDMWLELGRLFSRLSRDPDVRAIVFSGAGDRAFTAGLDVQAAAIGQQQTSSTVDGAREATRLRRYVDDFQGCVGSIERCEKRMSYFSTSSFRLLFCLFQPSLLSPLLLLFTYPSSPPPLPFIYPPSSSSYLT